jgi:hypothetical protein
MTGSVIIQGLQPIPPARVDAMFNEHPLPEITGFNTGAGVMEGLGKQTLS